MSETSTDGARAADEAAAGREDRRAVGELGFGAVGRAAPEPPDPELVEQAKRRKFTARYKLEILQKADACTRPGEVGELLRREGLYTSHLRYWRMQRKESALKELGKSRAQAGRPPRAADREAAAPRGTRGSRASEGQGSDRNSGKRLSALGADARYRGRVGGAPSDDRPDRRGADTDHRDQAGVPSAGRLTSHRVPPSTAA
jgi:transposase-like protein